MIRKWQSSLNSSGVVGAVLMDLSKAFDCLPHELLIAKLHAYGFGIKSLKLFYSYLNSRRHCTRVGSAVSSILEILLGVPQGSVLGPLLFNIFINDLILTCKEDICNFADDNTSFVSSSNLPEVLFRIENEMENALTWYRNNGMVANPHKFQTIFLGVRKLNISIKIGSFTIESSEQVKLLGITIDNQLTFYPHIVNICGKAVSKIKALVRIRGCLDQKQADLLFSSHIMAPFNYCPLVWMFCSKQAINLIQKTHCKALRARFNTFSDTLQDLLVRSNSVSIHTKNLRLLVCEVFKTVNYINAEIMWDSFIFKSENKYELRRGRNLTLPKARTSRAINSFDFRAAMAWNSLPVGIKSVDSLRKFNHSLETQTIYCRCANCTT